MEELLVKYFQGKCTPKEAVEVEGFKRSFPDEYDVLEKIWKNKERIEIKEYDTDSAWTSVWNQINRAPKKRGHSRYFYATRWAAVIVLFLIATILVLKKGTTTVTITGTDVDTPVELSDGTKVWLNQNAILTYPQEFLSDLRKVDLKGEAYFEVFQDTNRTFIVQSTLADIKVLGTSFNVKSSDSVSLISVTSGLVKVTTKGTNNTETFSKGEEALIINSKLRKQLLSSNFQSWRTGEFTFNDIPIKKVLEDLKQYYKEGLDYQTKESDCRLTASIKSMDIAEVRELLESVCTLETK
ncbi:MAG: FecR domain-containing protein [Bacteroidota bacterium]